LNTNPFTKQHLCSAIQQHFFSTPLSSFVSVYCVFEMPLSLTGGGGVNNCKLDEYFSFIAK